VLFAQVAQHQRGPLGIEMGQHQSDGLGMFGVQ
jgi:hypothetical protein